MDSIIMGDSNASDVIRASDCQGNGDNYTIYVRFCPTGTQNTDPIPLHDYIILLLLCVAIMFTR